MKVDASIDIGKNLAVLLQKLAATIGTTVDKIFPWYVHQEISCAIITIISFVIAFLIGIALMVAVKNKTDWNEEKFTNVIFIFGASVAVIALCTGLIIIPMQITRLVNPEYYALLSLTADMAKFIH